jgi:hypothetical protein
MTRHDIINPYRSLYRTFIVAAFLLNGIALFGFGVGNKDVAFWIGFTQFALFGLGIALLILGRKHAHTIELALSKKDFLAHWMLPKESVDRWAGTRYTTNKNLTGVVTVIMLFAGPLTGFVSQEMSTESGFMLGTILGAIAFLTGRMYAYDTFRRNASPPHEAIITAKAISVFNQLYRWNSFDKKLIRVDVVDGDAVQSRYALSFTYRSLYRLHKGESTVLVPIPSDKRDEAQIILSSFRTADIQ